MKTTIRLVDKDGKTTLQLLDLKYKEKVVAEKELSRGDHLWLIQELARRIS